MNLAASGVCDVLTASPCPFVCSLACYTCTTHKIDANRHNIHGIKLVILTPRASPMYVQVTVKVHAASPCHVCTASLCPFACSPSGQHMDHYVLLPTCRSCV